MPLFQGSLLAGREPGAAQVPRPPQDAGVRRDGRGGRAAAPRPAPASAAGARAEGARRKAAAASTGGRRS